MSAAGHTTVPTVPTVPTALDFHVVEQRRRRTELSPKVKKEICLFKVQNPSTTQKEVCHFAEESLGLRIGRSTVCDILKERDRWMALGDVAMSTRMRRPKYEELESALTAWCDAITSQPEAPPITDDMLRDRAKSLGEELGIKDFHYSSSWLSRYKMRRVMSEAVREEGASLKWEAEGPLVNSLELSGSLGTEAEEAIQPQSSRVPLRPSHYFYCEAFELRYRMDWHAGASADHLSVLLTFDLCAKQRLTPLVVWRLPRARCFGQLFDPNQLCRWRHSPGARLTADIVSEWLDTLDAEFRAREQRMVLFAHLPAHLLPQTPRLSNVSLYPSSFWPKADGDPGPFPGIAGHFKALFGVQQLSLLVEAAEEGVGQTSMDVKQALYCLRDAWAAFQPELVIRRLQTCTDLELPFDDETATCSCYFVEQKLNETLGHGGAVNSPKTAGFDVPYVELDDDSEAPAEVTAEEARQAAERLTLFAEQHLGDGTGRFAVAELDILRSTRRKCAAQMRERKRQAQASHLAVRPVKVERCDSPFSISDVASRDGQRLAQMAFPGHESLGP